MRMKVAVVLGLFSVGFAGMAIGQDAPIPARQELMKMNGAAAKAASDMIKGTTPYDAVKAADAMRIIASDMEEFPSLFPPGSESGGDTKASPKIWEDMAGFEAAAAKLAADAKTAEAAAANGVDAFKTAFAAVGADCGGCHETYRN
jgi:cytochrome c556